jgi:anti-sigma B factor antagonist
MENRGVGRISVDTTGTATWTVALEGEHDLSTVATLEDELAAIFAQGTSVVIDLSGATFMDSSVLRQLVLAQRRVDGNDAEVLVLVAPAGSFAARMFSLVGVEHMFTTFETRADALHALSS